jgi:hypothetical protein
VPLQLLFFISVKNGWRPKITDFLKKLSERLFKSGRLCRQREMKENLEKVAGCPQTVRTADKSWSDRRLALGVNC